MGNNKHKKSDFIVNYKDILESGVVEDLKYENGYIIFSVKLITEEKIIKSVLLQQEFNATAKRYYWDGSDNILRLRKITKGKFFNLESGID